MLDNQGVIFKFMNLLLLNYTYNKAGIFALRMFTIV